MEEERESDSGMPEAGGGSGRNWLTGGRLWILAACVLVAAAFVVLLLTIMPSGSGDGETAAGKVSEERVRDDTERERPEEQDGPTGEESEGAGLEIVPGDGDDSPGYVIEFPNPAGGEEEVPPQGEYTDIEGRWIIEVSGTGYGLSNCHLYLDQDGGITFPEDYSPVFEVVSSRYTWDREASSFNASLQVVIKLGSGQAAVPASLELRGTVSDSLDEIDGELQAIPQGETYAPYAQQGDFRMYR